ncbi:hypothetical protein SAMN05518672_101855 [Chitinophaga sp. CF118]|uniref:hypothetical protein n=1 Tax=Chitinophaga sp. CF118 TaxID=1884367 RepID=UPI0008ED3909|nr:hypothetical protein [Chitinophaga sp. CF118]SFD17007.1 hypothetical protein SAMN05518672_101855 [Chitinophaga sp. CF118]
MVDGLDKFREFFEGYEDSYIIIGGTACDRQLSQLERPFRTTNDVDIILIAEALTPAFVERFWEFIEEGEYAVQEEESENRQFYRFMKPGVDGYPFQLELFSRLPDVITLKEGMRYTPIPVEEGLTSLSAILMDDDYYQFTLENTDFIEGLHIASAGSLIALKAKAYLDLTERNAEQGNIDSKKIKKHRNDIVRLLSMLPGNYRVEVPAIIKGDLMRYVVLLTEENPDMKQVIKDAGLGGTTHNELLTRVSTIFGLNTTTVVSK